MMNKLQLWDEKYGLYNHDGKAFVSSRYVAQVFGKNHQHIMETIRKLLETGSGLSEEFGLSNFRHISYKDKYGREQPEFLLSRDGFTILVMGFTGTKAMRFKEAYIRKFGEMESYLLALHTARLEFPELTGAILEVHEKPMHYHFSNEMDMINRIVLGVSAKEFKREQSIRPYLTAEQVRQKADIGLVLTEPDFQKRKRTLEWYFFRLQQKPISA